jgi:transcription elongation GreA/GreB family factor
MNLNGLFLSHDKKKELEKELKRLETKGRDDLAERLSSARESLLSDDDEELVMVVEEKQRLEDRITEIRDLLFKAKVTKEECSIVADVGSEIVIARDKSVIVFKLVSPIEVDPSKNMVSVDSEVGKKLQGIRVNDKVKLTDKDGVELEYSVLYIC